MVEEARDGRVLSSLPLESNVIQVNFSPCGDYVLILSEEKTNACVRLSIVCTNVWN